MKIIKSKIILFAACFPLLLQAQYPLNNNFYNPEPGIMFEQKLSWVQILEKAKIERKYIFIDCYATWCIPCKKMDKDIYPLESVGKYVNEKYISVKVQMDTSKQDNEYVRSWYRDAHDIIERYKVYTLPTYLFFSPDGQILHRDAGLKSEQDFVALISATLDSNKQFYTLIKKYRSDKLDYSAFPLLAQTANEFGEKELANDIAENYINKYLIQLEHNELYKRANIEFISSFSELLNSRQKVFEMYCHHTKEIDSIMGEIGYAERFVDYVIFKEEIAPILSDVSKIKLIPCWKDIGELIKRKYGINYVQRNILVAKVGWYKKRRDWTNYTRHFVELTEVSGIEKQSAGIMTIYKLNNSAWEIFQYSNNKEELRKALGWVNKIISMDPNPNAGVIDTKANLLYKLGQYQEAIKLERQAVALDQQAQDMEESLLRMETGKKTWLFP